MDKCLLHALTTLSVYSMCLILYQTVFPQTQNVTKKDYNLKNEKKKNIYNTLVRYERTLNLLSGFGIKSSAIHNR